MYESSRDLFLSLFCSHEQFREKKNPNYIYTIEENFPKESFLFNFILRMEELLD